ncbi:hypothetical protein N7527_009196 [Penicillium freii]|nr:hypothetical protein N7527_009196 [Penicillium freii]
MARLPNKQRRQPTQSPDMFRHLDHPSSTLPVRKPKQNSIHPGQANEFLGNTPSVLLGAGSRITFRLTHRRHQRHQGPDNAEKECTAPTLPNDPLGHVDQGDGILKEKDREDLLRRLRPRAPCGPLPAKGASGRRREQV